MKNTSIYLSVFIFLLSLGSCKKDFLSENNKSAITQENYFTTAAQAEASITGIYPMLYTFTQEIEYRGDAPWALLEMPVGHINTGGSQYKDNSINHTNSANEPVYSVIWSNFYNGIANANLSIKRIPEITMNEQAKKSLLGEAYFLRAMYYYYLVRLYGDIPLITEPINYTSPDLYPERAGKEQIYEQIVSDLKAAETSGLPLVETTGRASLGAVKSLLASVYLTMAGYPLSKGADYYHLAATKAKEVLDAHYYKLFDNYNYLHDRSHKNKDELIFQVQYLASVKTNKITEFISPKGISKLTSEQGTVTPIKAFVNSYEAGDKRTKEKQFYFTMAFARGSSTKVVEFAPALYKFWLEEGAGASGDGNSDQNWTLLRLPEVMLIYAEAINEVETPDNFAYDQLNAIRVRAELLPLANLSKNEFRDAVWKERYHELAFENKSYFDVQRTHKVYNLSAGKFADVFSYTNESGVKFNEQYMLWPVPQGEIDANQKLKPQNIGW